MTASLLIINHDAIESIRQSPEAFVDSLLNAIGLAAHLPQDIPLPSCNRAAVLLSIHAGVIDAAAAAARVHGETKVP